MPSAIAAGRGPSAGVVRAHSLRRCGLRDDPVERVEGVCGTWSSSFSVAGSMTSISPALTPRC
jgi:hypothetical protein